MLRFHNYDIVFQEVPGEVTLAVNLTNCPNRCVGCHSPHLQHDAGEILDEGVLATWLGNYGDAITCLCFMGGDAEPCEVERLAAFIRKKSNRIKTAWYSGKATLPPEVSMLKFDYIKLGAYRQHLGGLNAPTTNQRFFRIEDGKMIDDTKKFQQLK
ncbi:MAG: anaerobic ribonucleoside-triphosphate reductase activating protein [Tannerellaceae bacterium]|jgi:anaerobic ribonucleoside-triphosphate reductase activating protein|nr:anaerobic ribonucleoside-triphosphate reductase activating protein [Tannerellaceae bacterium]